MRNQKIIYSENPLSDIWRRIQRYTYRNNIIYYSSSFGIELNERAQDEIISSIEQAYEYFQAAQTVSLQTSPLQLYYGTISLLHALYVLKKGSAPHIEDHGMKIDKEALNEGEVEKTKLTIHYNATGGFRTFATALCPEAPLAGNQQWSLIELLHSISDLYDSSETDRINLEWFVVPLELIKDGQSIRFDNISKKNLSSRTQINQIEKLSDLYFIQETNDNFIVKPKIRTPYDELVIYSISGRRFLQISHKRNDRLITLSEEIYMYMALFTLGTLSRYHARVWGSFIRTTRYKERELVEQFLTLATRKFPNRFLDIIEGYSHIFTNSRLSYSE